MVSNSVLIFIGTHHGLMVAFWTKITITNPTNPQPDAHPENFTIWLEDTSKSAEILVKLENPKFLNRKVFPVQFEKKKNFYCFRSVIGEIQFWFILWQFWTLDGVINVSGVSSDFLRILGFWWILWFFPEF